MPDEQNPCKNCGGSGMMVTGENRVTRDMATDAGYPDMEGMHHSFIEEPCEYCLGSGIEQPTNPSL